MEDSLDINKILEIYNINRKEIDHRIFVTRNNKYRGFLSLNNLFHFSYKKYLQIEKEALTK